MKLRDRELIKKKINVKDKYIIKELKDIYEKYLKIRNKAEENFSFYLEVAKKQDLLIILMNGLKIQEIYIIKQLKK